MPHIPNTLSTSNIEYFVNGSLFMQVSREHTLDADNDTASDA